MSLCVTKLAPELIVPSEPTPDGNLPLSFMDRLPTVKFLVDTIHVYVQGEEPAKLIREALSKALVPYYPMAGRFTVSDQGELEIACNGEGIWFIEASADFSLKDVNNLELPLLIPKEDVLPYLPPQDLKDVISLIQVTQFRCGGFSVGIRSDHAMTGGSGIGQFLQAVVEMAKGLSAPTIKPFWGRGAIPSPAKHFKPCLPPFLAPKQFENLAVDVSSDQINQLKDKYFTATGQNCSTFDALLAKVWQSRAQAINLEPDASVRVGFAASTRHLMKEFVPVGYYGNCGYPLTITVTSEKIRSASFVDVVSLIKEAKDSLPTLFSKWMEGDPSANPFQVPPDYGLLAVSDWSKVGFQELDFGWGEPLHFAPVDDNPFIASCIFLKPPRPKHGVRLMTRCVVNEHFAVFRESMRELE